MALQLDLGPANKRASLNLRHLHSGGKVEENEVEEMGEKA